MKNYHIKTIESDFSEEFHAVTAENSQEAKKAVKTTGEIVSCVLVGLTPTLPTEQKEDELREMQYCDFLEGADMRSSV